MLSEYSAADWRSRLGMPPDRKPRILLLHGTRDLRGGYDTYRSAFTDMIEVGAHPKFFYDLFVGRRGSTDVAYASVYGSPMAAEIAHVFCVLGVRLIIQTGSCGSLVEDLNLGNVCVVRAAYAGDGASGYYLPSPTWIEATRSLGGTSHLSAGFSYRSVYSTAALIAESRHKVKEWIELGCEAVDLETAATLAVAAFFGVDSAAMLIVSDHLLTGTNLGFDDASSAIVVQSAAEVLRNAVLEGIDNYVEHPTGNQSKLPNGGE